MKKLVIFFFISIVGLTTTAQGTLQFNQAKIIDNNQVSVPTGKVWKVTAVYGNIYNTYCAGQPNLLPNPTVWVKVTIANGFITNGKTIFCNLKYSTSTTRWTDNTCTTSAGSNADYSSYSQSSDPLILPQWLPAGTTLKSLGQEVLLSVIEFNIIP